MKYVYKYSLSTGVNFPDMHAGAQILSVGLQDNHLGGVQLVLWALVDDTQPLEAREVQVLMTGEPIEMREMKPDLAFVGTVQTPRGLVMHVFAEPEQE